MMCHSYFAASKLSSACTFAHTQANAIERHGGDAIILHDLLARDKRQLIAAQHLRDQGFYLDLGKVDANADAWPTAEANQRIGRLFVFFAGRRKAVGIKYGGVGEDL